jgi:outer membrane immunogenic protein
VTLSLKSGRDLYIGGRIGYPVAESFLLYAKGGYTNARVKAVLTDGRDKESDGINLDGYRIGAGVEYTRSKRFLRLEYRYSDYGKVEIEDIDTGISVRRHQVAVTAGLRF